MRFLDAVLTAVIMCVVIFGALGVFVAVIERVADRWGEVWILVFTVAVILVSLTAAIYWGGVGQC